MIDLYELFTERPKTHQTQVERNGKGYSLVAE